MGNYGIKVTKTGFDVGTASIANQSLNSTKNSFKIFKEGVVDGTVNGTLNIQVSVADTFSSSTFPAFLGFIKVGTIERWYPPYITEQDSGKNVKLDLWLDPLHLKLNGGITSSASTPITIYFYELIEPSVNI